MANEDPRSKTPLPPLLEGFGKDDARREAAAAEFGLAFGDLELGKLDELDELEPELAAPKPQPQPKPKPAQAKPVPDAKLELRLDEVAMPGADAPARPNLEPVGDDAHPPQNRRMPTQPPSALALDLAELRPPSQAEAEAKPLPPPPKITSRHSPTPVRRGMFSMDRPTNLLAGAAVGLLLSIFPAKKLARSYEVSEVEPQIAELEGAIAHPLGVEAGVVEDPRKIAARITDGRKKVRQRYITIWLLVGLPIGLGLGFAPRPGD